jgi:NAD(P)H dehydrogenase (quinone)
MKHAVIFAHPRQQSFTGSAVKAYAQATERLGHRVIRRDLYRIPFDPCLQAVEMPGPDQQPALDVMTERAMLQDADVFALFYPLWLNAPPAMMKGYLERVFGFGFAYGGAGGSAHPLLTGRKLIVFSSSGAPANWVRETGALEALRTLFDSHLAELCGLTVLDHVHFGNIVPGATREFVQGRMEDVRKTVIRHFGEHHESHEDQADIGQDA